MITFRVLRPVASHAAAGGPPAQQAATGARRWQHTVPLLVSPKDPVLKNPNTVLLDATWLYKPNPPTRSAAGEFVERRLKGARYWSLDEISEPSNVMLMLPNPDRFAAYASAKGVTPDTHVVVYDTAARGQLASAPRTLFSFKAYQHAKVSLLDGGLPRAIKEGLETESGPAQAIAPTDYPRPTLAPNLIATYEEVVEASKRPPTSDPAWPVILDTRLAADFNGLPGVPTSGHIPEAHSIPFPGLVTTPEAPFSTFLKPEEFKSRLREVLGEKHASEVLAGSRPVIGSCGGGLSIALLWLHLQLLGLHSKFYDESWHGYSQRPGSVIARNTPL